MSANKNNKQMKCSSCGGKLVKIGDGLYKCALCGKKKRVEPDEDAEVKTLTAEEATKKTAESQKKPAEKKPAAKKADRTQGGLPAAEKSEQAKKTAPKKTAPKGKDLKKKVIPGKQKKGQKSPAPYKKNVKEENGEGTGTLLSAREVRIPEPEVLFPVEEDPELARLVRPTHEKVTSKPDDFGEPLEDIELVIPPFPYVKERERIEVPQIPNREMKTGGNARICDVVKRTYDGGVTDGEGSFTCPNGTVYEGMLREGLRDGKGKTTYRNGDVYEGEYSDDAACGKGVMTKKDGSMYAGMFEDDKWCGEGIYRDMFGYLHVGTFGYLTFEGRTYLPDEDAISGDELYNKVESWFAE